jgi:hypothetical protein
MAIYFSSFLIIFSRGQKYNFPELNDRHLSKGCQIVLGTAYQNGVKINQVTRKYTK